MDTASSRKTASEKTVKDPDISAIRLLLAQEKQNASELHSKQRDRSQDQAEKAVRRMASKAHQLPALSNAAAETPEENVVAGKAVQIGSRAVEAVRNYRPESKLILRTSLILLLLLQPFFILGSMLVTVLLTFACYFYAGSDRFWRKIIRAYGALAKRQPDTARSLKLRAYVISRQWDSIVGHLPERVADAWRSPDLRSLVRADENHARAMNKRLDRLY